MIFIYQFKTKEGGETGGPSHVNGVGTLQGILPRESPIGSVLYQQLLQECRTHTAPSLCGKQWYHL